MMKSTYQLVLVRHGHTDWNLSNRFTGWSDVPLSVTGLEEVRQAGLRIKAAELGFDEAHVSALYRTKQALDAILSAAHHANIPVHTSWRLNERHYGSLQGMNKDDIYNKWGREQTYLWWRGFDEQPPALALDDPLSPRFNALYKDVDPALLPQSESLFQCQQRLLPYWHEQLMPKIKAGKKLIVVSHGNTLRALRMYVEEIDSSHIQKVEIPLGIPFVYHFDEHLTPIGLDWLE